MEFCHFVSGAASVATPVSGAASVDVLHLTNEPVWDVTEKRLVFNDHNVTRATIAFDQHTLFPRAQLAIEVTICVAALHFAMLNLLACSLHGIVPGLLLNLLACSPFLTSTQTHTCARAHG